MNSLNLLLWGVFPYIVLTIFIGGLIYRYQKDQFGWTTKSSEIFEKSDCELDRSCSTGGYFLSWAATLQG